MQFLSLPDVEPEPILQGGDRYAGNWSTTSRRARQLCPICCWCKVNLATEVHHAVYWDDGPIKGRETIGQHVFPVCDKCHDTLHSSEHWYSPVSHIARRNYPETHEQLKANLREITPLFMGKVNAN